MSSGLMKSIAVGAVAVVVGSVLVNLARKNNVPGFN